MTSGVRDLIAGAGIELVERGRHTLKGVPGTWDGAGGRDARTPSRSSPFPPPRTSLERTHRQPAAAGRPVRRPGRRSGAPRRPRSTGRGSSPSRARPAWARRAWPSSSHGSWVARRWFVDLSRVTEGEAVAAAFLDTLGVSPRTGVADGDRIVETLECARCCSSSTTASTCSGATAADHRPHRPCRARRPSAGHEPAGARRRRRAGARRRAAGPADRRWRPPTEQGAADAVRMFTRPRRAGRRDHRRPRQHRGPVPSARRHPARPRAGRLPHPGVLAGADPRAARRRLVGVRGQARRAPRRATSRWRTRSTGRSACSATTNGRSSCPSARSRGAFDVAAASAVAGTDVMTTADRLAAAGRPVPGAERPRPGRPPLPAARDRALRSRRAGSTRTWRPPPVTATPRTSPPGSTSSASGCRGRTRTTRSVSSASSSTTCRPPSTTPPPPETSTPRPGSPTGRASPCRSKAPAGRTWPAGPARCLASRTTPLRLSLLASAAWSAVLVADVGRARELAAAGTELAGDRVPSRAPLLDLDPGDRQLVHRGSRHLPDRCGARAGGGRRGGRLVPARHLRDLPAGRG